MKKKCNIFTEVILCVSRFYILILVFLVVILLFSFNAVELNDILKESIGKFFSILFQLTKMLLPCKTFYITYTFSYILHAFCSCAKLHSCQNIV